MKNTKTKSIVALAIVLVLTVVFGIVGVTGMSFQGGLWKLLPWLPTTNADAWPQAISLGLDLRGGVYVEYSAEAPEGNDANFSDLLDATVSAIQSRLTDKGYAESTVQVLGTSGIRVEIPDVSDPSEILNLIGEPALLEFKDPDGNTFMTGSDVRLAQAAMTQDGQWAISFQLTSAGTKLFADMTSQNIGKTLGIYLDGEKLMAPTVQSAITGGAGQITGNFTMDRAQTIAAQIQSGALPLVLTQQKVDTVSATLGDNALSTSVFAAIIGIALVMLIMIVRYRLNGVVASWALCIYTIVLFWVLAVFPGIQGGPLMHVIAAKAVCFGEDLTPQFKDYAAQVVKNAQKMGEVLQARGLDLVSGGTDTHLLLVDLRPKKLTGDVVAAALERANITCNKNAIPFDPMPPKVTSGIRVGTPAGTTRGFKETEFEVIANWIGDIIDALAAGDAEEVIADIRQKVIALCELFPIYG